MSGLGGADGPAGARGPAELGPHDGGPAQLGLHETEVAREGPLGRAVARGALLLAAAALGIGGLAAGGVLLVNEVGRTPAGLCGRLLLPCTVDSLDEVQRLGRLALPSGSEVLEGGTTRVPAPSFEAAVRLPEGEVSVLGSSASGYGPADRQDFWQPALDRHELADPEFFAFREAEQPDIRYDAVQGTAPDGRTIVLLRSLDESEPEG